MTGADIIGAILIDDGSVPAAQIKEDRLPDDVVLTAYLVRTVTSVDHQTLRRRALVRKTDRISVTVRASSVRERKAAINWVRDCCAGKIGDIAGAFRVAVLTAGLGPSLNGPANTFEQTQDFRVSYDAPI